MHNKNYLHNYLLKLTRSGLAPHFGSVACRYGKITMYCIMGPDDDIVLLTFDPAKHEKVQKQLKELDPGVRVHRRRQQELFFNSQLRAYFTGGLREFSLAARIPLIAAGTPFQQRIWAHIAEIPYGCTVTYQELAELAGSPQGARAAGTACGANPVAVIIPCHRVVGVSGLGGFAGGLKVKKILLALERRTAMDECR